MDKTVYICTGGCGAVITQEQFDGGLQACGTKGCLHHRHPFEKRKQCGVCGAIYKEEEQHSHS